MSHGDREDDVQLASGRNGCALGIMTSDLVLREMDDPPHHPYLRPRAGSRGASTC